MNALISLLLEIGGDDPRETVVKRSFQKFAE